jgi:hypothetical protein
LAWWRGYLLTVLAIFLVEELLLRPWGNTPEIASTLKYYELTSLILALTAGGVIYGLAGRVRLKTRLVILVLSVVALLVFTSVPMLSETRESCMTSDMGYSQHTTELVSLWLYLGGDGGTITNHGYVWATYGGSLPC